MRVTDCDLTATVATTGPNQFQESRLENEFHGRRKTRKELGGGRKDRPANHMTFAEVINHSAGRWRVSVDADEPPFRLELLAKVLGCDFGRPVEEDHVVGCGGGPSGCRGPVTTSTAVAPTAASASLAWRAKSGSCSSPTTEPARAANTAEE